MWIIFVIPRSENLIFPEIYILLFKPSIKFKIFKFFDGCKIELNFQKKNSNSKYSNCKSYRTKKNFDFDLKNKN